MPWLVENEEDILKTKWDGTYRIVSAEQSSWSEAEVCLDTYSDTHELYVGEGDHSGKHWTITPIEDIKAFEFLRA